MPDVAESPAEHGLANVQSSIEYCGFDIWLAIFFCWLSAVFMSLCCGNLQLAVYVDYAAEVDVNDVFGAVHGYFLRYLCAVRF